MVESFTVKEASEILGMSKGTLHALLRTGTLKHKWGQRNKRRVKLIERSELLRYLQDKKQKHQSTMEEVDWEKLVGEPEVTPIK